MLGRDPIVEGVERASDSDEPGLVKKAQTEGEDTPDIEPQ